MIVVDTNVVAYCWTSGERSAAAQRLRALDADWRVPLIWRSEFRSVLCGWVRRGELPLDGAQQIRAAVEDAFAGREHTVAGAAVLDVAAQTRLSAYDAEFVVLAEALAVPLVTEDREILARYAGATSMKDFLAAAQKGPPSVHSPRVAYRTGMYSRLKPAPQIRGARRAAHG